MHKATWTIPQFCDSHNISRTHLYDLIKQGKGPRLMKLGRRTLISAEAAADWRRQMEAETSGATLDAFLADPIAA
ncbi:helix-turn-helix transcriptional regulator [Bordetella genomosp. 9]|uniref:Helix-turn-helix domain-containing protein n=1 Tax=Bordetella genomosp. 9 TaxID=1416803 RepID=A0A1W6YY21_9BORD|nr:helix-turn-helix domain-containing protein [Bordetella genomosp. 9]ARP85779.1 hypothetical protein CAL13_05825 [Bordetella genomosp. 9]